MDIAAILERLPALIFGLAFMVGILGFLLYRVSWRWRTLAALYAAGPDDKPDTRHWTNIVLRGGGPVGWNTYSGIAHIGVNRRGITVSIIGPFNAFHTPLFFDYGLIAFEPEKWLLQDAFEFRPIGGEGVSILINKKAAKWIASQSAATGQRVDMGVLV